MPVPTCPMLSFPCLGRLLRYLEALTTIPQMYRKGGLYLAPLGHSGISPTTTVRSQAAQVNAVPPPPTPRPSRALYPHVFPGLPRDFHPRLAIPSPLPPQCDIKPKCCGNPQHPHPAPASRGHLGPKPALRARASHRPAAAAPGLVGQAAHHDAGAAGRHNGTSRRVSGILSEEEEAGAGPKRGGGGAAGGGAARESSGFWRVPPRHLELRGRHRPHPGPRLRPQARLTFSACLRLPVSMLKRRRCEFSPGGNRDHSLTFRQFFIHMASKFRLLPLPAVGLEISS